MPFSAAQTAKIFLVGFVGISGLLTEIDNILDYRTNFEVVRHVTSMDALPPGNVLMWRAMTSSVLQQLVYWIIIVTELLYGSLCIWGAFRLFGERGSPSFNTAKGLAASGLAIGFALYFFGFLVMAGEWFQMWHAGQWKCRSRPFASLAASDWFSFFLSARQGLINTLPLHLTWQQ